MELVYIGRRPSIIVNLGKVTKRVLKGKSFSCEPKAGAELQQKFNVKGKDFIFVEASKLEEYWEERKETLEARRKARVESAEKDSQLRKPVSMEAAAMQKRRDKEKAGEAVAEEAVAEEAVSEEVVAKEAQEPEKSQNRRNNRRR